MSKVMYGGKSFFFVLFFYLVTHGKNFFIAFENFHFEGQQKQLIV